MALKQPVPSKLLSTNESERLVDLVTEHHISNLSRARFVEAVLDLFEDICGFETITRRSANRVAFNLWRTYMAKKSAPTEPSAPSNSIQANDGGMSSDASAAATSVQPQGVDLSSPLVAAAIARGKLLIADGKSKADAAREIYASIKAEEKDTIVAAFVEGATLTPKGALTYWYNCKRRAAKGQ